MVPLSQRRHRLHVEEIPEVMEGLVLLLTEYVRAGEDLERATLAFRPFYRMLYHRTGRPNYPEPTTCARARSQFVNSWELNQMY